MINSRPKNPVKLVGVDSFTILLVAFIFIYLLNNKELSYDYIDIYLISISLFILISYKTKIPKIIYLKLDKFIVTYIIIVCVTSVFAYFFPEILQNSSSIVVFVLALPILGFFLYFAAASIIEQHISDKEVGKKTLVAGIGNLAVSVEKEFKGNTIKGFIKCHNEECLVGEEKIIGDIKSIDDYLKDNAIDEIVIALPLKASKKIRNIMLAADHYGVRVKYVPDYESLFGKHYKTVRYGHIEAVNVRQLPLDESYSSIIKNCFDRVFSIVALLLLMPIFIILAVLIKLDSSGPVFYCPVRIGKAGKPFKVYKFRSMRENDIPTGGLLSTTKDDKRITRIGRIMRKYSLDELPQFLNVLLGQMSVVGPRPHRRFLNQQLQESVDKYMIRHYFKPGITGWAQVNGWRGPTETEEQKTQRTLHDIWYMENWSLLLDLKIIFLTIFDTKVHKSAF
ncbi:exopolysaccharide biosynthesis polyprenyl glycosylphosphotransferase [Pontibacter locisalis]|uniref:Exopolysaccharide biosynthesis polyprenyl glycosylphosphotransferase n=1 Tax=Pontibacter locisalis TaxID=1719035 RepID=A0ABW5IP00_9BACT